MKTFHLILMSLFIFSLLGIASIKVINIDTEILIENILEEDTNNEESKDLKALQSFSPPSSFIFKISTKYCSYFSVKIDFNYINTLLRPPIFS